MEGATRDWRWGALAYVLALALTLAVTTIIIIALGHDPVSAFRTALKDSVGTVGGLAQTLNRMTPLLLASLAFALGFKAGAFNIGMDGQIYAGAILATGAGFLLGDLGPGRIVGVPVVLIAATLGGALWILLPALMRVIWGVNEIFTTVMLNFVALYLVEYLSTGPWNDPMAGEAITLPVPRGVTLPMLLPRGGAHSGVLLAAAVAVAAWAFLYRTRAGYELRATGSNPLASQLAGISLGRIQVLALLLSGAAAGLGGGIEVAGVYHRLLLGLTPDYGIMGILIAVLGRFHPVLLIPANFAFAVLVAASDSLQRTVGFPSAAVFMLQALVVIVVIGVQAL
ncbi:MAG TPA: ABC transporter permease, partial [Bacillota bacterium]